MRIKVSKSLTLLGAAVGVALIAGSVVGGIALASDTRNGTPDVSTTGPAEPGDDASSHAPMTTPTAGHDDANDDANDGDDADECSVGATCAGDDDDMGVHASAANDGHEAHDGGDDGVHPTATARS